MIRRSRAIYFALAGGMVIAGLASRRFSSELPWVVAEYAGDTLWATMVYAIAATLWNKTTPRCLGIGAAAFCCSVELSQLYNANWINSVRATRIGGLVLGHGFLWSDLVCYAAGVVLGICIDSWCRSSSEA